MGMAELLGRVMATPLHKVAWWLGVDCPAHARDRSVTGICSDSRQVVPGSLFFAISGHQVDGHGFLPQALAAGAQVVVSARQPDQRVLDAGTEVLWWTVPDVRRAKALVAQHLHGNPSQDLACVGITGTNGKTTTAAMLEAILEEQGWRTTVIGTTGLRLPGGRTRETRNTTPDSLILAEVLAESRALGARSVVLEVSSHALVQQRTAGVRFAVAVFTQLSHEHLDYHQDLESYRDAKGLLFAGLDEDAVAVLNAEDPTSQHFLARTRARVLTYGRSPGADVRGVVQRSTLLGTTLDVFWQGQSRRIELRCIGGHNVQNALAALGAARALGVEPDAMVQGLEQLSGVPGRLQPVLAGQDFRVLIDYAHTDDALEKVLCCLSPLTPGRLLTVFGCGGDRDPGKRERMGRVASRWSDHVFVTSDNPRGEDPGHIAAAVAAGVCGRQTALTVELNRRVAIRQALLEARTGDVVLIAGKGHETTQTIGGQTLPFDDRVVAEEILWQLSA